MLMGPQPGLGSASGSPAQADEILKFWFQECRPIQWFRGGPELDQLIRTRFGRTVQQAINGNCLDWHQAPTSALALVLLLDQFPRHIWRGRAAAYDGDSQALQLSLLAEKRGWLQQEEQRARRQFWLMPRLHSEDLDVQTQALDLFERWTDPRTHAVALRHREIIRRFGRFPHRNSALKRSSTPDELRQLPPA